MLESQGVGSVVVIVTAMNEEGNLDATVANVVAATAPRFPDYEILIIEDGSTDRTPAIADRLAGENPRIRVHHNGANRGLGHSLRTGLQLADGSYVAWVAANNIVPRQGLEDIYDRAGAADVVLGYVTTDIRGLGRRLISRTFLRYFTGPWICRREVIRGLVTTGQGSMIVPEIPIRLIYGGASYLEVGLQPQPRTSGKTKTFRFSNFIFAGTSIARLFWELRVAAAGKTDAQPSKPPSRGF